MNNVKQISLICIFHCPTIIQMNILSSNMRNNVNKVLFFSITLIAFYSCNTLGKISIQVAVPPKYPVSNEIQSIVILNHSLTSKFSNLERDSLEKILVKHNLELDTVFQDSVAADTAIQVAAKALFESQRFDVVVPKDREIVRDDFGGLLDPLDPSTINDLCKEFNVDGVLVLENFSERVFTDFATRSSNFDYRSNQLFKEYDGIINLSYDLNWRLYQPQLKPSVLRYEVIDTIFWDASDYSLRRMYEKLPSIKEALIGGGIAAGQDLGGKITPTWKDEIRKYYITGNKEIDAAIPLIKQDKWEEATEIWMKFSKESSGSLRSKVEFNLALAAEMTGPFNLAIEWAIKSYKSKYSKEAELYMEYLDQRRAELQKTSKNL